MTNRKNKEWTKGEVAKLKELAKKGIETPKIAKNLGRTKNAIYSKASEKKISLKPKDK